MTHYGLVPEIERLAYLLEETNVSDILIYSSDKCLFEKVGNLVETASPFADEQDCRSWVQKLFAENGGRIDLSQPIGEVSIYSRFGLLRVHVILAGECSPDTQISIRRHSSEPLSLSDLLATDFLSSLQSIHLLEIIRAKENFVIVGGTGSGKTTLLRAMLSEVSSERVITIEENFELGLKGNAVALKTRENNHEGVGEITLSKLLRNVLRMRPDRLVIGEARGEELLLLLQSLNTGHSGAGFTLHANSHRDALRRMLSILAFAGVPAELVKALVLAAVNWVIEVKRTPTGRAVVAIQRLGNNV
jgi:pilus assembly protein CpaF